MVYLTRLEAFLLGCLDQTICNLSRSFNGVVLIYIDFVIFCVRAKYIRFWILLKEKQTHVHSRIGHYFFSYFLTCLISQKFQKLQLKCSSLFKPETNNDDFRRYVELFEKKLQGEPPLRNIKNKHKNHDITMDVPPGVPGVSKKLEGPKDQ